MKSENVLYETIWTHPFNLIELRTPNFKAFEGTCRISQFPFHSYYDPDKAQAHTRFYNSYKSSYLYREAEQKMLISTQ